MENKYGVEVDYFKRELKYLLKTVHKRPKDDLRRYLIRLADVADVQPSLPKE